MTNRTVYTLVEEAAAKYGDAGALYQPLPGKAGGYHQYTWKEYRQIVREIACGLRALGFTPADILAIGSETRAEFYFADIGIMTHGSTSAALYVHSLPAEQVAML